MKKVIVILLLMFIFSSLPVVNSFWASYVRNNNHIYEGDTWIVDNWRQQHELAFINPNDNQILRTQTLIYQQPIPSHHDLGRKLWFLDSEFTIVSDFQQMPNNDLNLYGMSLDSATKSMGTSHGFIIDSYGRLWSWGNNENGRTGLGLSSGNTLTPTLINTGKIRFVQVDASSNYNIALDTFGRLWSWGSNLGGRTGLGISTGETLVPTLINTGAIRFVYVSAAGRAGTANGHGAAIDTFGRIWSWGPSSAGQTGLGTFGDTLVPTLINTGETRFKRISLGTNHSLALDLEGRLWSWGSNINFLTGLGTGIGSTLVPRLVETEMTRFMAISASNNFNISIDLEGRLWSWGSNEMGATGLGITSGITVSPTLIYTSSVKFRQIDTGVQFATALSKEGRIFSWGSNNTGRTGLGLTTGSTNEPRPIILEVEFVGFSSNSNGIKALDETGRLWTWGSNANSRLGMGTIVGSFNNPTLSQFIIP